MPPLGQGIGKVRFEGGKRPPALQDSVEEDSLAVSSVRSAPLELRWSLTGVRSSSPRKTQSWRGGAKRDTKRVGDGLEQSYGLSVL